MRVFNVYRVVTSKKEVVNQLVASVEADRFELHVYTISFFNDNKSFFGKVKSSDLISMLQLDPLENYLIQADSAVPAPIQKGDADVTLA